MDIVSLKLAANEQLSRTPAVLGNAIDQRFNTNNSKIKSLLLQKIIVKFWEWCPPKTDLTKKTKRDSQKRYSTNFKSSCLRCSVEKMPLKKMPWMKNAAC